MVRHLSSQVGGSRSLEGHDPGRPVSGNTDVFCSFLHGMACTGGTSTSRHLPRGTSNLCSRIGRKCRWHSVPSGKERKCRSSPAEEFSRDARNATYRNLTSRHGHIGLADLQYTRADKFDRDLTEPAETLREERLGLKHGSDVEGWKLPLHPLLARKAGQRREPRGVDAVGA